MKNLLSCLSILLAIVLLPVTSAFAFSGVNTCAATIDCNYTNKDNNTSVTVRCPGNITTIDERDMTIEGEIRQTAEDAYIPQSGQNRVNTTPAILDLDESSEINCKYNVTLYQPLISSTKEKAKDRKLTFNYKSTLQPPSSAQ